MHAFVTGGSGFVGGHLIRYLVQHGHRVTALARSTKAANAVAEAGAEPVEGDLERVEVLRAAMAGCDVVFHAAAHLGEWNCYDEAYRVNVEGTRRLIEAALAANVPKLVHVSTEAILTGGGPIVRADETRPRSAQPVGVYPITKGLAEEVVLAANAPALATMAVRPRFVWGEGDATMLPKLVQAVQSGQFMWFDGGRYLTSTCHVRNVCEGLLLAAERGRGGEIYFLTDGEPVEFRAFVTAMLKTQGVERSIPSVPHWVGRLVAAGGEAAWRLLPLPGQPPLTRTGLALIGEEVTVVDEKARRELGYQGRVSREAGLAELAGPASDFR